MTARERFCAALDFHVPSEGLPLVEWAPWWDKTLDRWRTEGLDPDLSGDDAVVAFGLDPLICLGGGARSAGCPAERTHGAGIITDEASYERIRRYLYADSNLRALVREARSVKKRHDRGEGIVRLWLDGYFWFPRVLLGIERHLFAFHDQPDLLHRINADLAAFNLRVMTELGSVLVPDMVGYAEDMSYNHGPMLSKALFDEFLAPYYRQVNPAIRALGSRIFVDSDGDVAEMVPWLLEAGIQGVYPLERQAGVDVAQLRLDFPGFLMLGGFDKRVLHLGESAVRAEFERLLPVMRSGGFIPSMDHQTPPEASLEDYRTYLRLFREYAGKSGAKSPVEVPNRAQVKIQRLRAALQHREGDRIPVSDFFWTGFVERAKALWGPDFDPYRHFDLDYIVLHPNMDPHIQPFDILSENGADVVLRTGFEAVIRRSGTIPMPHFVSFSVTEPEQMAAFRFDSPSDRRRFHEAGDDQLNGVGDALSRNIPAWSGRVDAYADDLAIFGSICEPYEYLWRIIGSENALVWQVLEPEAYVAFVDRIGEFLLELARAQIREGAGRLSGFYIWGDVAYRTGMLFNPEIWRKVFLPHVKRLVDLFHENGLMVVYHGCGNATPIFDDLAGIGLDAYNPLEAKADLDVVELRKRYGKRLSFVGNIDVRILETGDREAIRREVLYKMQAGQGGGWVCQSDHSVSSGVTPESYALVVETVREFGRYPLDLDRIRAELGE